VENAEDIHMFVEQILTNKIGNVGKKLHTARSRNDQVALDMHLFLKKQIVLFIEKIKLLINEIIKISAKNLSTIMPAFTHLQKAQPSTVAHYMMAYAEMFYKDLIRMQNNYNSTDFCPLGAGALCGTTYNIDQQYTAKLLGFKNVISNSMEAISDRDYIIEFLNNLSILMMHMSRINEEFII
jgi:argininosuccinate lyase